MYLEFKPSANDTGLYTLNNKTHFWSC